MDVINFWNDSGDSETDKINIIKTWLCNGSDGQTYPISDHIFEVDFKMIDTKKYDECSFSCEKEFDEIVGFKHDYKIDDFRLDDIARKILDGLNDLTKDIYSHPEKYFEENSVSFQKMFCHANEGINCDYAIWSDSYGCDKCTNHGVKCPFKSEVPIHPLTKDNPIDN